MATAQRIGSWAAVVVLLVGPIVSGTLWAQEGPTFESDLALLREKGHNGPTVEVSQAAERMIEYRDERAIPVLIDLLSVESVVLRLNFQDALFNIGTAAIPPLIAALSSDDLNQMLGAVSTLKRFGDAARARLISVLGGDERRAWRGAALALKTVGDSSAVEPLIRTLAYSDAATVWPALDALGAIGDSRAVAPLIEHLRSDSRITRLSAVRALGQIGDTTATLAIMNELDATEWRMRASAASNVGIIGDTRAVPSLLAVLETDDRGEVIDAAARALGTIGSPSAVPALTTLLVDWYRSEAAAEALSDLRWAPPDDRLEVLFRLGLRDAPWLSQHWAQTESILSADLLEGAPKERLNAANGFITLGRDSTVALLVRALRGRDMAQVYINSGKSTLREAAEAWAEAAGYRIVRLGSGTGVRWGG